MKAKRHRPRWHRPGPGHHWHPDRWSPESWEPDRWDPQRWDPQRWDRGRWRQRRRPHLFGSVVLLALVQVFGTRAVAYGDAGTALDSTGYLLLVAGPAALILRGRWPLVALVCALVPTVAYFGLRYPVGPGFLAVLVAMFTALSAGYRWLTWLCLALAYAVYAALALPAEATSRVVMVGIWCLLIAVVGEQARVRGVRYVEVVKARAEQQERARAEERRAQAEQERARAEQQRRQASEERLRIARELHDVLGHHLSLISVQAGVGLHLMDDRPDQARAALTAIKHASAEALRETRAVLAALNPGEAAPRAPAPGLADLADLVAEVVAAGLPVTVSIDGEVRPMPAEVDRAAYRIVQEALTNVRRHAGRSATAVVAIRYGQDEVTVEVTDDGTGVPDGSDGSAVEGNGLAGMRQRALTLGGSVEAGPREAGGFAVNARLPLKEGPPVNAS